MPKEPRPRVAVVGGFYELDDDPKLGQEAREYARALGGSLAETGFGLVVYFSNDKSLEPHVVRGFVAALPPGESAPCIDVRYSEAQRGQVRFDEQDTHPQLFHEDPFPGPNWEAPFYRSLAARDSVQATLLMAGGQSTLNAGQVAMGRGLPLLAIDKYTGSARILRTELATRINGYPSSQGSSPLKLVAWLWAQHEKEAERLRQDREREREFARIEEQVQLKYKAAASLGKQNDRTTEITKDVSAMANSDGGTVIYGMLFSRAPSFKFVAARYHCSRPAFYHETQSGVQVKRATSLRPVSNADGPFNRGPLVRRSLKGRCCRCLATSQ